MRAGYDGQPRGTGVYWSLAVEEHFYLVWPFLVRWLSRGAMLALSVAIVACVPMFRGWAFQHAPRWNTYAPDGSPSTS